MRETCHEQTTGFQGKNTGRRRQNVNFWRERERREENLVYES